MTEKKAKKIAKLLKEGKTYKQGHYQHGYEYFEYDEKSEIFKYTREDLGLDWANPDITEMILSEDEFLQKIIAGFEYQEMKEYIT